MFETRYFEAALFFAVRRAARTGRRHSVRRVEGIWYAVEIGGAR